MDKLFIIDGNSLVFRAFYALPPMFNSSRTPTNAAFGFFKMLINIIVKNKPKYMAVAFDAGKHTFRHNLFHIGCNLLGANPLDLNICSFAIKVL